MINIVQKWKDKILGLVDTNVKLVQLLLIERISKLLSVFIFVLIFILLGFGIVLFIGLGVAEKFSAMMDDYMLGYFTSAGCYLILGAIIFLLRKKIVRFLANIFINVLTDVDDNVEDSENLTAK